MQVANAAVEAGRPWHYLHYRGDRPVPDIREAVVKRIGALEIFIDAALEVCKARDPKGLDARAPAG